MRHIKTLNPTTLRFVAGYIVVAVFVFQLKDELELLAARQNLN